MNFHISQIMKQNETNISAISESTPESQPMNQASLLTCLYLSILIFVIFGNSDRFRRVILFLYLSGIKILVPRDEQWLLLIQHLFLEIPVHK